MKFVVEVCCWLRHAWFCYICWWPLSTSIDKGRVAQCLFFLCTRHIPWLRLLPQLYFSKGKRRRSSCHKRSKDWEIWLNWFHFCSLVFFLILIPVTCLNVKTSVLPVSSYDYQESTSVDDYYWKKLHVIQNFTLIKSNTWPLTPHICVKICFLTAEIFSSLFLKWGANVRAFRSYSERSA